MTLEERQERDNSVMAELRAKGGTAGGRRLVILAIAGSKSGQVHHKPVCVAEEASDLVVAASAGGQRKHPQWYQNLTANPQVTVEYLGETFATVASTVSNGPDRDQLFERMSREIEGLYSYQDRCRDSRQIPIVRLTRI
jgi:F420H(2)-dependent quinone reductase